MTSPVSDGSAAEPPVPSAKAPPPKAPSPKKPDPVPPARPSGAQILASVLTATTSTFALSYLGVAGTIIGAGLASTFTVLANYWYTRSIIHTQRKVNQIAPKAVRARTAAAAPGAAAGSVAATPSLSDTQTMPAIADTQTLPAQDANNAAQAGRGEKLMAPARASKRRILIPIALLFVLLLAVVTAVELGLGKPLSDALRGQEGTGTSIFHSSGPRTPVQDEPGYEPNEEQPANPDQGVELTEDSTTEPGDAEPSEPATTEPAAPETTEPAPEEAPAKPTKPADPAEPVEPADPEAEGPTSTATDDAGGGSNGSADKTPPPAPKDPALFSVANNG